jgi:hypothetical protein
LHNNNWCLWGQALARISHRSYSKKPPLMA